MDSPGLYCLQKFDAGFDYMIVTVENGRVLKTRCTCKSYHGHYGSSLGGLKNAGWSIYDEREDYSAVGIRLRYFMKRRKPKLNE